MVEGYEATHDAKEMGKIFHVSKYTVYHLEECKRKTGSVELQIWRRGNTKSSRYDSTLPAAVQPVSQSD